MKIINFCLAAILLTGSVVAQADNTPNPATDKIFHVLFIDLYQSNQVMVDRLGNDATSFIQYATNVKREAANTFAHTNHQSMSGTLVVAVKPGNESKVWLIMDHSQISQKLRTNLIKRLEAVPVLSVAEGPIAFSISFDAWGGSPDAVHDTNPIIPIEWQDAMRGQPTGVVPDAPLAIIWPTHNKPHPQSPEQLKDITPLTPPPKYSDQETG